MSQDKIVSIFSTLIRLALGTLFIVVGIKFYDKSGWMVIAFGALIFVTAFLKPRRCIGDNCNL